MPLPHIFVNSYFSEFKEAFLMVDKTDTGIIPKSELGKIVRALGYNPSEAEIAKVQVTVDPEGSYTSFKKMALCPYFDTLTSSEHTLCTVL